MAFCKTCDGELSEDGSCPDCVRREKFVQFAMSCGLTRYPRPDGERYIYRLDGSFDGKKSECIDFIDELWSALVRSKGGDETLLLG